MPPILVVLMALLSGDLLPKNILELPGTFVPPTGPVNIIKLLSGARASILPS